MAVSLWPEEARCSFRLKQEITQAPILKGQSMIFPLDWRPLSTLTGCRPSLPFSRVQRSMWLEIFKTRHLVLWQQAHLQNIYTILIYQDYISNTKDLEGRERRTERRREKETEKVEREEQKEGEKEGREKRTERRREKVERGDREGRERKTERRTERRERLF